MERFSREFGKMKVCTQCKSEKSEAEFIKIATGRHSMCDPCRKEYMRDYNQKRQKLRGQRLW